MCPVSISAVRSVGNLIQCKTSPESKKRRRRSKKCLILE
jgi:hypothetical protein